MEIFARSPKTCIFWKRFFKNRPKSSPRLKGTKARWRKWHYLLICMLLNCKDWRRFLRRKPLQKCPNGQVMEIFARSPKTCISEKRFLKNRPKISPRLKGPKALWRKWHYPLICIHLHCKTWKRCWWKKRLRKCPNSQVMVIFARLPKTRIFWKSSKGGPREIVQKSPKQ